MLQSGNEDIASDCTNKFSALNLSDDALFSVTTDICMYTGKQQKVHVIICIQIFDLSFNMDLLKIFAC